MNILTVDCGTTNSRVYVVDETGTILGKGSRSVGVRDTSRTGSTELLERGLEDAITDASTSAGITDEDIDMVLSSGMITSELGLKELPHLEAPVTMNDLARHMERVDPLPPFPAGVPVYFVRGIKNSASWQSMTRADAGLLDFMRAEETQAAGILAQRITTVPATIVMLSSHTKFISIDETEAVRGSITTLSGQVFSAILAESFIGKSIEKPEEEELPPLDWTVVEEAYSWTKEAGLLRSLLMTRFMDVLIDTEWYERRLFVEAALAASDLTAFSQFDRLGLDGNTPFVLIGDHRRCELYRYLLREKCGVAHPISIISEIETIDSLSIRGVLNLAERNGIL